MRDHNIHSAECRFCGRVVGLRLKRRFKLYKPQHYTHKCPHGYVCLSSSMSNNNWPAIFLGNPPKLAKGCPICHKQAQDKYDKEHGRKTSEKKNIMNTTPFFSIRQSEEDKRRQQGYSAFSFTPEEILDAKLEAEIEAREEYEDQKEHELSELPD